MALDRILLFLKVGDSGEMLDGMPICYLDEQETGVSLDTMVGQNNHRVFCPVQIDRRLLPKIQEWLSPIGYGTILGPMGEPLPDAKAFRLRGSVLPLSDLATAVNMPDLEAKARSTTDTLPIINGTLLGEEIFKSSSLFSVDQRVPDLNSIASGSYTVGSGGSYATWALFSADLAATLTGALTGTQISATTETAISTINPALAGYTLTLTSDTNPLGNFGGGWLITASVNLSSQAVFEITGTSAGAGAKINISKLNMKTTGTITTWGVCINLKSNTANITNNVNDCLFNCNSKVVMGVRCINASNISRIFNCVAVNGTGLAAGSFAIGFVFANATTGHTCENCTAYGFTRTSGYVCGICNYNNGAIILTNNLCIGNYIDFASGTTETAGTQNATSTNNSSSDTTGGWSIGLVASNEFISTTITDSTYLKLTPQGYGANSGATPGLASNTYGIRGNTRPRIL